jgi:hypothetical protein
MERHIGRDRTLVDRATRRRDDLWKEAFTDFNYNPPKPRTKLVTKQGNRVYIVKWTPQLTRPGSTQGAAGDQPSGDAEEGPPLIWTRETSPGGGPLRPAPPSTTQAGAPSPGHGRTDTAASGAGMGPTGWSSPDRPCWAADSLPGAQRVANAGHPAAGSGSAKLGRYAQRRCTTAGVDAGCPGASGGTAAGDHQ